ncbi:hypothetical protein PHYPSEUDO_008017 [Phytophthora pseudosyringae]|uniref:Uncharacterized protein n=1 Tax=Phytophthora pseudosyringae TaxID=221518 RepID=A0A8T1VFA4_9STRA|nr:hypothetical protein PHYPSEUDO_008017 [Phytophthora pseudosyringae]
MPCKPDELNLWFATTADVAGEGTTTWLQSNADATLMLQRGETHRHIEDVVDRAQLDTTRIIGDFLKANKLPLPGPREIHVLVEMPQSLPLRGSIQMTPNSVERIAWTAPEVRPHLVVGKNDQLIRLPWAFVGGSGIGRGVGKELILYRRAPLRKQWHEIYRCVIRTYARFWVVGPPGTGQSCTALAFAYALNPSRWDVFEFITREVKIISTAFDWWATRKKLVSSLSWRS